MLEMWGGSKNVCVFFVFFPGTINVRSTLKFSFRNEKEEGKIEMKNNLNGYFRVSEKICQQKNIVLILHFQNYLIFSLYLLLSLILLLFYYCFAFSFFFCLWDI